jgi:hypothetical protein
VDLIQQQKLQAPHQQQQHADLIQQQQLLKSKHQHQLVA